MPHKLSPNEIRDITARLEAGKQLTEKYRFALFGDQRNLEFVWDGKTTLSVTQFSRFNGIMKGKTKTFDHALKLFNQYKSDNEEST